MKRFLYLRGRGRSWASRVSLPGMPARVRVGPDRERAAAMCSKVSVGLSVPIGMLCLPRESGADLNFVFFRIYANTLPTQSARQSCFQLPQSALRCPGMPVLSAEQWHVTGRTEESRDESRE